MAETAIIAVVIAASKKFCNLPETSLIQNIEMRAMRAIHDYKIKTKRLMRAAPTRRFCILKEASFQDGYEVNMKKFINAIYVGVGFLLIGIGVLGVILPVLPATPFLVGAAICFAKGSIRFHKWFLETTLYLKYVEPAVTKKEMEKSVKRKTLLILCVIFTISFLLVPIWHAKAAILIVALFHIYYFAFKIKTVKTPPEEIVCNE